LLPDLNLALRYCSINFVVKNGEIFAWGGNEIMTPETIGAVYGVAVAVATVLRRSGPSFLCLGG
jgi:iron complex transport system ATP-binding protein